jgi:hypothetical protein
VNDEVKGICDDGFSQTDAEVACHELYGDREVVGFE